LTAETRGSNVAILLRGCLWTGYALQALNGRLMILDQHLSKLLDLWMLRALRGELRDFDFALILGDQTLSDKAFHLLAGNASLALHRFAAIDALRLAGWLLRWLQRAVDLARLTNLTGLAWLARLGDCVGDERGGR
jgi:hypothetical protein